MRRLTPLLTIFQLYPDIDFICHHIQNIGDKVCNFLEAGRCISHGTLFSSFNKGRGRRDRDRIVVGFRHYEAFNSIIDNIPTIS
jgi:hypothetical protein